MVNYAIDSDIRRKVIIILVVVSLLLLEPINLLLETLYNLIIGVFPFIETPFSKLSIIGFDVSKLTFFALFGLLYGVFIKLAWKFKLVVKLTKVPNLNGVWEGKLISSFKAPDTGEQIPPIDMSVEIKQNWTSMSVCCYFPKSTSYSKMTSLHINDTKGCVLGFSYRNDSAEVTINTREFSGYNELVYKNETLSGVYFTNREDGTHGTIELKRLKK